MLKHTRVSDPELYGIVAEELDRQERNIEMIASESTECEELLELSGCVFANKTTEGYPGARFQAGSQVADKMERLGIERAKALYGADHANLQPYSGSTANYGVYAAVLKPGDSVLGMRLDHGGHLTHGSPANFMSKFYNFTSYGLNERTEQIDYDELETLAREHKPRLIIAGGSAYPRLIDYERIAGIAHSVGGMLMVDMAHIAGLVAAKVIPSPVPYADFVTSSTTKTLCGPRGGMILCKAEHAKVLDRGVFPGAISSIHLNIMAAKTWLFKHAATSEFRDVMLRVVANARTLADEMAGYGFRVISGGTDNHIVLLDLRPKGITGKLFQDALEYVGITINKNMIPSDPEKPSVTSGVRIGTTSVSQRSLGAEEIKKIAAIMNRVASAPEDGTVLDSSRKEALELIANFPLYPRGPLGEGE
ncbi:MAG: serine hydroxymethyltransferase [Synergistaceae bacterium]|nr:serine hydroxymethyltransferase [Synergistota bacterium]NLM70523.1 serine hydroxymethyltransferase [Synergistaceae bacterium]